jgi:hypothetical protein
MPIIGGVRKQEKRFSALFVVLGLQEDVVQFCIVATMVRDLDYVERQGCIQKIFVKLVPAARRKVDATRVSRH